MSEVKVEIKTFGAKEAAEQLKVVGDAAEKAAESVDKLCDAISRLGDLTERGVRMQGVGDVISVEIDAVQGADVENGSRNRRNR